MRQMQAFQRGRRNAPHTPTAVIKPIMRREGSLGVKRFGRSRRGPVLAKAGLSLYQDAAQTLHKERYS